MNRTASTQIRWPCLFKSSPMDEKRERQTERTVANRCRHTKEIAYHGDYPSPRWFCVLAFGAQWVLTPSLIIPQAVGSQSQSCCF